jgi:hypothetical protein
VTTWNPKKVYALAVEIWYEGEDDKEVFRDHVLRNLRRLKRV